MKGSQCVVKRVSGGDVTLFSRAIASVVGDRSKVAQRQPRARV